MAKFERSSRKRARSALPTPSMTVRRPDEFLHVRYLNRTFGTVKALDKVSFAFERGQIFGFIGPNGAGKTTTMRILATLDLPDSGEAWVDGISVLDEPRAVRRRIGFMSDQFVPYAHLNVHEYLDFFARAVGLVGRQRIETVAAVANFCQLTEFQKRPTAGLSKGMSQRLHLAKTLLHDPSLLILDEPANGLDPRARIEFRDLLRELAGNGKSILISSHILAELSETCDGIIVIERGQIVTAGALRDVRERLGELDRLRVRIVGDQEARDAAMRFFLTQQGVVDVRQDELDLSLQLDAELGRDEQRVADLQARAVQAGLRMRDFHLVTADLEQIFMQSTRGRLQ